MPRFRTGHRVPLNVYDGDRPIFQAHSEQDAVEWVALLNVGHRAGTITTDEVAQVLFSSEAMPVNNVVLARDAADAMAVEVMHLLLTSRETPVERPESPSEPPPATGQPADDSGSQDVLQLGRDWDLGPGWVHLNCGFCGHWEKGQFTKEEVAQWLRVHRNAMLGPNEGHTTTASTCPHPCGGAVES